MEPALRGKKEGSDETVRENSPSSALIFSSIFRTMKIFVKKQEKSENNAEFAAA